VDVPHAEVEELLPAAQLLQRSGEGPRDYEAAKAAFLGGLSDFLAAAELGEAAAAAAGGQAAEAAEAGGAAAFRQLIERFEQGTASSAAAAASAAEVGG
jgi:hypothetical protein